MEEETKELAPCHLCNAPCEMWNTTCGKCKTYMGTFVCEKCRIKYSVKHMLCQECGKDE